MISCKLFTNPRFRILSLSIFNAGPETITSSASSFIFSKESITLSIKNLPAAVPPMLTTIVFLLNEKFFLNSSLGCIVLRTIGPTLRMLPSSGPFLGRITRSHFWIISFIEWFIFFSIKEPNPLTNRVSKISVINTVFIFFLVLWQAMQNLHHLVLGQVFLFLLFLMK